MADLIRSLQRASDLDGADAAALNDAAAWLLRDPQTSADPAALDQACAWLRDAVVATPGTHPKLARRLSNLGSALRARFERTGVFADLEEAVQVGRDAVAASPTSDPDRAPYLHNLGVALRARFEQNGVLADLDEAVQLGRDAVAATAKREPDRAMILSNLGAALTIRFLHTGVLADLDEAVQIDREAVAATPSDHPERAVHLSNLSGALTIRFQGTGILADLDDAVQVGRDAVAATPTDHPASARYLSNLGAALRARFEGTGAAADLDEAVQAGRDAVAANPTDHPDRPGMLSNLGAALTMRFERTGVLADLGEAVHVGRDAVAAAPTDHPDRARCLSNLSGALVRRLERTGVLADLDEAVQLGRDAVAATSTTHPNRATYLSDLELALQTRFQRTGALADLDEAVQLGRDAVAATPAIHPSRPRHLTNLSGALVRRFERTGALTDLDEAVQTGREAVTAAGATHSSRALVLSNLGAALLTRFARTEVLADLETAVRTSRDAVTATPADHPMRATYLTNVGNALQTRFERTGALADLDEAVQTDRQAVAATPADHPDRATYLLNLGLGLRARFNRTGVSSDRVASTAAFRDGARQLTGDPRVRADCGRGWAELAATIGDWRQARQALSAVLDLLPMLVKPAVATSDRQHRLEQLQGLGPDAARAAMGNPKRLWRRRHRAARAWSGLEDGRGVLLRQALAARSDTTALRSVHPELADQLDQLRTLLAATTTAPSAPRDPGPDLANPHTARTADEARTRQARDTYQHLEALLAHIRQQPRFTRFGLPPTIDELKTAATGGAAVALTVTDHGCGALILTHRHADYLPLPQLTAPTAIKQANIFLTALRQQPVDIASLHQVLAWLWNSATGPVIKHLGHTHTPKPNRAWPRIWWIPTAALSVLPIHAAGHHTDPPGRRRRTVLDRVVSSYTPTVQLLAETRNHTTNRALGAAAAAGRGGTLAVGINNTPNLPPQLKFAEAEATQVQRLLDPANNPLLGVHATHDHVATRLADAGVAHFACHAMADHTDPSRSYLALHDGPLPVAELSQMNLPHAQLAFLSACTTATGSVRLLDESIHIASAFQLAGYQDVIATLWPINDYLAPDIATHVHAAIATGSPPHLALHHTIHALRDVPALRDQPQHWASHVHFGP